MKKNNLKLTGIIGDPVSHSLSPLMHNAAFAHLEISYLYLPFPLTRDELKPFLKSLSERDIAGLNVTIPHKENVIPYMDSLSAEAKMMGAVNTIQVKKGRLKGFNTDGWGFIEGLKKESKFNPNGKNVVLLGAGGAARGIAMALLEAGAKKITIANRTPERALELAQEIRLKLKQMNVIGEKLEELSHSESWKKADLLINATAMGMKGLKLAPLPWKTLPKKCLVSDIVYTPLETPFLKIAKKHRLKTNPGWPMLLYQGTRAFEIFTGKKAPVAVMKKALLEALT